MRPAPRVLRTRASERVCRGRDGAYRRMSGGNRACTFGRERGRARVHKRATVARATARADARAAANELRGGAGAYRPRPRHKDANGVDGRQVLARDRDHPSAAPPRRASHAAGLHPAARSPCFRITTHSLVPSRVQSLPGSRSVRVVRWGAEPTGKLLVPRSRKVSPVSHVSSGRQLRS